MAEKPLPDYYGVLQVHPRASDVVIKKAYRTLMAAGAHPDAGGSPERARLLTEAYDVLTNPDRRRAYDLAILMPAAAAPQAPSPTPPQAPSAPTSQRPGPRRGALLAILCFTAGLAAGAAGTYAAGRQTQAAEPAGAVSADASYYLGAGIALLEVGEADKSEEHLRRAVALSPTAPEPLAALGTLLAQTGRPDAALDACERALAAYVREGSLGAAADMHARMADLALGMGDRDRAIREWRACFGHPGGSVSLKARARRALSDLGAWYDEPTPE